jgi:WD40-like Beta Propeller Repeat
MSMCEPSGTFSGSLNRYLYFKEHAGKRFGSAASSDSEASQRTIDPKTSRYTIVTDRMPRAALFVGGFERHLTAFLHSSSARLLTESFMERDVRISPDGRWLAFVSDESGRPVVSVRSVSAPAHVRGIRERRRSEPT